MANEGCTNEERAGRARPLQMEKEGAGKLARPFDGFRASRSAELRASRSISLTASKNCYNRAELVGGGRSEVIWRDRNRLRRNGHGYR